ncbi:GGDEF domain-containing protein [Paenibacillus sp. LHD-117]|uniref:GGDEF domain-containing protein n=1 Tax=Paenibacillus sp. LHD-117 TaxID=3071412 RepID=UPI0027E1F1CF|nr:GGDEF domain-containing protein [Paenibacillus sp. LHD-117]MDQ6419966.1 GGDEF domain-containing protein [Paenibacillus sp. LHD-117]
MSRQIRSFEDAARLSLHSLKHLLDIDTVCFAIQEGMLLRVIQSYNRNENGIDAGDTLPILYDPMPDSDRYSPFAPPTYISVLHLAEDIRFNGCRSAQKFPHGSLASFPIMNADHTAPIGSIVLLHSAPIALSAGQVELLLAMSSQAGYMIGLENACVTDSLTGLFNRRYLAHLCGCGSDKRYSVLFIDIDDFKAINDRYGHDTGDALLQEVAGRLRNSVRKSDVIIRYGGDEFIVCLQHLAGKHDLQIVADKIKLALKQPYRLKGDFVSVYASVGMSSRSGSDSSLRELINEADQSMYGLKQYDKNH